MNVIANVFQKLQTVKNLLRPFSKKRSFSEHAKASQILAKSPSKHFYYVFPSFSGKLIWKISSLMLGGMLGVSVNTLGADCKYPVQDCQNLLLPMQMQLSE